MTEREVDIGAAHGLNRLGCVVAGRSGSALQLPLQLGEAVARERRENRFAVAEVMIRSLVADARFPRHLPHAETIEPPLADQGKARLQHFLAQVLLGAHDETSWPTALDSVKFNRQCQVGYDERMTPMTTMTQIDTDSGLTAILARQRAAFLRDGPPSLPSGSAT